MKKLASVLILMAIALCFVQCAKRGTPTGGPEDLSPPEFIRASPENFSVNFDQKEIRIYFDEYIKLENAQKQIIISPPMDPKPEITPLGSPSKYIKIIIRDTLQENTTYAFNFGQSIVDNNEGNPLPFFKYVFSTGSYIDSLSVKGIVQDALLKEAEPFISVMLYELNENYSDSLVFNEPPRYITNTLDSLKTFELSNLKEGTYQLVAVKDLNNNYKYDPGREKIAFLDQPITIPADTTYNLTLFKEIQNFKPERPKQTGLQKLLIGYRGGVNLDSISIKPISGAPINFEYQLTKVDAKDSLNVWFKPKLDSDSLKFTLRTPKSLDTLLTRITAMPKDSISITTEPSGTIDFGKNFIIRSTTPITTYNDKMISVLDQDSLAVSFTSELKTKENSLHVMFDRNENQTYYINVLPGAVTDFYNSTNDTIVKTFKTMSLSDYGNVTLNLQNVRSYPILVQLTDEKGVMLAEKFSDAESTLRFDYLPPAKYLIRVIYDENGNRKWDTGNYLKKIKPEEIIYFPEAIDVRANWDINQSFMLN